MSKNRKSKLSVEELIDSNQLVRDATNRPPSYYPWKLDFYCPISPDLAWHKKLSYKECPVCEEQRDMGACANCKLRGKQTFKLIKKEEKRRRRGGKNKRGRK